MHQHHHPSPTTPWFRKSFSKSAQVRSDNSFAEYSLEILVDIPDAKLVFQLRLKNNPSIMLLLESGELGLTHNYARDQNVAGAGGFSAWQQAGPSWN